MIHPPNSTVTLRRAGISLIALLVLFCFLALRIFSIQFFDFERYQKKVIDQMTTESPVRAARGQILDAVGRVLATNQTVYNVSLFPNAVARADGAEALKARIASGLSALIDGLGYDKVIEHLSHTSELERTVARGLGSEAAQAVLAFIEEGALYEMIAVEAQSTRYYPYGSLAAHLLGFTGSDGQGLYGLELQYNAALAGQNGSYITARDSTGNRLPNAYEAYQPATDGYTLITTVDAFVQAALERELERTLIESNAQNRVCGIVMDVQTGAILAMATGPDFDLNSPFALNEESQAALAAMGYEEGSEAYRSAKNQLLLETWSNKAVTEIYMPGSTFKTLTCSMVLEEGVVSNLNELFFCSGCMQVADRSIHCHKKGGHGSLTFTEGLQNSCNPVMMSIASRLGTEKFYEFVKQFGLLEKTGIDLPGESNSIFHAKSAFTELDLATASFGQNFKVSILQMITAVSAVANGGRLITPYVVERMEDAAGNTVYQHQTQVRRTVISEAVAATVSEILAGGVAGDGGAKNAYVAGYRVAAKTGTSEKIGDDKSARIGSCVAYAPADDPQLAVIIVVDEPTSASRYGSVVAAPYVANVLESVLPYLGVEAVYTEQEAEQRSVTVPDVTGLTPEQATTLLESAGFQVTLQGEGGTVTAQTPRAGEQILLKNASITLSLGEATVTQIGVPEVVGMSAAAANKALVDAGFNVAIEGAKDYLACNKSVSAQYPAAGTVLSAGDVVRIRFEYDEKRE